MQAGVLTSFQLAALAHKRHAELRNSLELCVLPPAHSTDVNSVCGGGSHTQLRAHAREPVHGKVGSDEAVVGQNAPIRLR